MRYRACYKDFHTTKWIVTMIIKLQLPPKLLMTPRIPRGRGPPWPMATCIWRFR